MPQWTMGGPTSAISRNAAASPSRIGGYTRLITDISTAAGTRTLEWSVPPEVLEPGLAQGRAARGMRERDVAEPVLDREGVDAVVGGRLHFRDPRCAPPSMRPCYLRFRPRRRKGRGGPARASPAPRTIGHRRAPRQHDSR